MTPKRQFGKSSVSGLAQRLDLLQDRVNAIAARIEGMATEWIFTRNQIDKHLRSVQQTLNRALEAEDAPRATVADPVIVDPREIAGENDIARRVRLKRELEGKHGLPRAEHNAVSG